MNGYSYIIERATCSVCDEQIFRLASDDDWVHTDTGKMFCDVPPVEPVAFPAPETIHLNSTLLPSGWDRADDARDAE